MLKYTTVVCREEGIDVEKIEDAIAKLNSGAHAMGDAIWKLTAKMITINNICKILERQFDVTQEECYEETTSFLKQLLELQAVKITESSQTTKLPKMPRSN
ncbi:PqqD family peptide modification chaperone [Candidatus Uabimicrobium sp. HlEnr_7]|uniref:PqqD family peptide modification chaperone n=1 Tax=Candidatus Uabimicrobium helgolandensis TaxID=3095367 RepID=UPI0035577560